MNVHDCYEKKLEYISMFNGVCLNVEEKLKLEIAFNEIHNKVKCEELWFWGKLFGNDADYYIALGINYSGHYEFPEKLFYYCTNTNFNFQPLPVTFDYHDKDFVEKYKSTPISGNPNLVLKRYVVEGEENAEGGNPNPPETTPEEGAKTTPQDPDESIDNAPKVEVKKENFTEALKISYIVRNIDFDTNIVPQGSFKLLPVHELARNESFKGLKSEELKDLSKYHHFRPIQLSKNKQIAESEDAVFRYDFLDSIQDDTVQGSWSVQVDSTKTIVNYFFYFSAI